MNATTYEQFYAHIKWAYRGPSRRPATRMQGTEMLLERQREDEQCTVCAEVKSSLQVVVRRRSSNSMKEGGWLVLPI